MTSLAAFIPAFLIALFGVETSTLPSNAPSSPTAMTEAVAHEFQRVHPKAAVSIAGPLELRVKEGPTTDLRVSLDPLWADCKSAPRVCDAAIAEYVRRSAPAFSPAAPVAPERIVAAIRPRSYFERLGVGWETTLAVEPFAAGLELVYMVDMPEQARVLNRTEVASLHLADVANIARTNLAARLPDIAQKVRAAPTNTVIPLVTQNYWESSRLLQKDVWAVASVRGAVFAAVPETDTFVFMIDPTPEVLAKFTIAVRTIYQTGKRPLSPSVFRWTASGWVEQKSP